MGLSQEENQSMKTDSRMTQTLLQTDYVKFQDKMDTAGEETG